MNNVMSDKRVIFLYIAPSLFLILALIYVPIVQTGYFGLMEWDGIGEMKFVGLKNYSHLIHDHLFWKSAYHSFLLALFSALSLIGYLCISIILAERIRGADLLRKIYLIPMLLASVAIAQLWIKIYHPGNGILNHILMKLGVQDPPSWLADPKLALFAIIVPIVWQYAGFYILIYYAALKNIPDELLEAAKIDGATTFQIATKIKLPLIMNVIKVTIVLAVVGSLKYFDLIYIMTGGGPNGASEVMASYMYNKAFKGFDFGYGSAVGFFLLVICLVTTYLIRKLTAADQNSNL
ncbi:carbohydrate ABC transporter permease [Paenactinomyces guangxiensis]|uniref:Sugar ABC transporter permease n=1 Tax=Paenactinomyces guangxiensis TaxID=1490290 RepID=A0A7W2A7H1_9BACL|nr:sugar ABC transporter permease [Paenactinomyces guangxiensis]MBA4494551.1 sugar ABC transporter permease [Paenactinomyces guangxiensis]MBH8591687.1 sugar ABC transporter permease [Paenactinomyces guangxiensis]